MATLARLFDFIPGDVIRSADVDAEFNQLVNILNGTTVDKQIIVRLNDPALATLIVDQTTASATSLIQTWRANGIDKVFFDGLGRIQSTVAGTKGALPHDPPASGNVPAIVASTARIINLNADMLDGLHSTDFVPASGATPTFGDITISDANPRLTWDDTDVGGVGDIYSELNTDGTNQQLTFARVSDNQKILRLNVTQGTAQFHNVVSLRHDDGSNVDVNVSVGGSIPDQHLVPKKYVDDAILAAGGALTTTDFTRRHYWTKVPASAAFVATGFSVGPSTTGVFTTQDGTDFPYGRAESGNVLGNSATFNGGFTNFFRLSWGLDLRFIIRTPYADSGARYWFGISDTASLGSDVPAVNLIAFRHSNTAGDIKWAVATRTAAAGTTTTEVGPAYQFTTGIKFRIVVPIGGASVQFYINDSLVATHNTNIPSTSIMMGFVAYAENRAGGGGTERGTDLSYMLGIY